MNYIVVPDSNILFAMILKDDPKHQCAREVISKYKELIVIIDRILAEMMQKINRVLNEAFAEIFSHINEGFKVEDVLSVIDQLCIEKPRNENFYKYIKRNFLGYSEITHNTIVRIIDDKREKMEKNLRDIISINEHMSKKLIERIDMNDDELRDFANKLENIILKKISFFKKIKNEKDRAILEDLCVYARFFPLHIKFLTFDEDFYKAFKRIEEDINKLIAPGRIEFEYVKKYIAPK